MNMHASADIVIRIDTIDQLFNDPAIDPFSEKPSIILGKAALAHAIRQELGRGLRGRRLIIQLPPDQIGPGLQQQVANAVRKYAEAKRADNEASIRISRWRSLVGLIMAIIIAFGLLAFLGLAIRTVFASASDAVTGILAGLVTIFIWSTVWNPWDRLVYEWIEPWLENRILNNITMMDIVVQPEPVSSDRT
jgi:hypothetical protein